ncbi:uncharacterized protein LOC134211427 [Armigeres subalbatus]|uniref:uncharacterized protein LOC134211427 n=1 Tax=Armigeres subalbatus TaxID=124917 RepID=UPI002ECFB1AA
MGVFPSLHTQAKQSLSYAHRCIARQKIQGVKINQTYQSKVMAASMFSRLDPFDCQEGDFDYYLEQFQNFLELNSVEDESKKVPLFISSIGQDAYKILKEICAPSDPKEKSFDQITALLVEYFARQEFYLRNQRPGEKKGVYVNEMKRLSLKCNFGPFAHHALRDRIACGKLPENTPDEKPSIPAAPTNPSKEPDAQQQQPSVPQGVQPVAEKKAKGPKQQKSGGGAQQKKGHIALTSREKANKASQQQQQQPMEVHVHVQQNTAAAGAEYNLNPDDPQKRTRGPRQQQQGGRYGGGGAQQRRGQAALTSHRRANQPAEEEQSSCAVIM